MLPRRVGDSGSNYVEKHESHRFRSGRHHAHTRFGLGSYSSQEYLLGPRKLVRLSSLPNTDKSLSGFDSVKYDLPFYDNSFDLVRMANLSLAIPYLSWPRVLSEVRRVLTQGGRLELIDDHIFFPYGNSPSPPPTPTITPTRSTIDSFCSIDYDDSIPDDGSTVVDDDVTIRQKLLPPTPSVDRVAEWEERAENARGLETMFQRMLEKEFRISSRASAFTLTSLQSIFGRSNSKKFKSYHLALAAAEDEHDKNADSTADGKKPWIIDWDRKDKKRGASGDDTHVTPSKYPDTIAAKAVACLGISTSPSKYPDGISPKAAGRLGIPARPCRPYAQSPGLVLYPSTFIPMDPMHLEMHACKHMHVLLGCKLSLARVMADVKDDKGEPMVKRDELDDLLWEYEWYCHASFCFVRADLELIAFFC
jgi:SAM-dependent methyltransferase